VGQTSWRWWVRLTSALLGVLGLAVAISAVVVALPPPAVGGTCGPGRASEAPIAAFFDPVSIGAGARPPTTDLRAWLEWSAFVGECQSSADARMLLGLGILVLTALVVGAGFLVTRQTGSDTRAARRSSVAGGPPPGWYWDPAAPTNAPRWWTGGAWGPPYGAGASSWPAESAWHPPGAAWRPPGAAWHPPGAAWGPPGASWGPLGPVSQPSAPPSSTADPSAAPTGLAPPPP
jgi:hypothetical protein